MDIERLFVDRNVSGSAVEQRILQKYPHLRAEIIEDNHLWQVEKKGALSSREFNRSKKWLHLTSHKGSFFKRCPGAKPGLSCCNYFVLNLGLQCNMNCSYCYLQSFINSPVMQIYTNISEALDELKLFAHNGKDLNYRVGTGETIDSLSLDHLTHYSRTLIEFFKELPKWQLEFKTKSSQVDQFLDLGPAKNVVVSWSINPQYIVESEEHGTASLIDRIAAAKKCRDQGFTVAFHIDPVIWHPNWKQNYSDLVDSMTKEFSPIDIPYVSLGALRFQPNQRHMMRERFGMKSHVTSAEMFVGSDGKFRYDKNLRQEMFVFIRQRFTDHSSKWNIFLCMEAPETWLSTYSKLPKTVDGLKELFDHKVVKNHSETQLTI